MAAVNKRIISVLLTAIMIFPMITNTALATNPVLEEQGSITSIDNSLEEIESGGYTIEEESTIVEETESELIVDKEADKVDSNEKSEVQEETEQENKQSNIDENTNVDESKETDVTEQQTTQSAPTISDIKEQESNLGPKEITGFKYEVLNYKSVLLTWEASEGATHYVIYRSTDSSGVYEEIAKTEKTSYKSEVSCGILYYYKVVPYADTIEGKENIVSLITKPNKISKLQSKVDVTNVTLTWKASKGAQSYSVYRSTKKSSGYEKIGETKKTKYTDKSTTQGKSYYYKVYSKSNGTEGEGVRTSKASKIPNGPKAVKSLKYKADNYNTITLNWKASKGASKYVIYRATSKDGKYKKLKTINKTTYTQKNVKCGQIYYYKIVPYAEKLQGKEKIIKAFTKPDQVTKLKTSVNDNQITLTWKKAKGAAVYEIYRSTKKNSGFVKVGETKKTKYTDKNLTYGETYYYQIYAVSNGTKGKKVAGNATIPQQNTADITGEMRAVWISYLDYGTLKDKSKSEFTKNINAMYDNVLNQNVNTVIVHVRAFSDAIYPSKYYRWANFITSKDDGPDYDPLKIMIEEAHKKGLSFQAWINPYRTADGGRVNPGSTSAIKKIVAGVEEIVTNYDVDGIHFDDYFYLSTDQTSQDDKMENVNRMVSQVYAKIKSIKSNVIFGISPAGNIDYAKSIGCDVDTWLSNSGYIDYICPQLYWSDEYVTKSGASTKMFTNTMKQWTTINKNGTTMYAGLALYKVGYAVESTWGDDVGWGNSTSNLYNQYKAAKGSGYHGYSLYRYASISLPAAKDELNQLKKMSN